MLQPTTVIENIYMKVSWSYPDDNSDPVEGYDIEILQSDGVTYSKDLVNCDGMSPAIIQSLYCFVPMTVLRASPFSLPFEASILVKVRARNSIGWGAYSTSSTAATTVQVEPVQMNTPTRGSLTSYSQIQIVWNPLTTKPQTGDSPIITY